MFTFFGPPPSSEPRFSTKFGRVKKRPRPSLLSDYNGNVTAEVSFSACAVVNSLNLLTGLHINVFTFILFRDVLERRLSFFIFLFPHFPVRRPPPLLPKCCYWRGSSGRRLWSRVAYVCAY